MTADRASCLHKGVVLRRWYVYATDGWRRVVWAETSADALVKARRSSTQVLMDRVDPAPPMGS